MLDGTDGWSGWMEQKDGGWVDGVDGLGGWMEWIDEADGWSGWSRWMDEWMAMIGGSMKGP